MAIPEKQQVRAGHGGFLHGPDWEWRAEAAIFWTPHRPFIVARHSNVEFADFNGFCGALGSADALRLDIGMSSYVADHSGGPDRRGAGGGGCVCRESVGHLAGKRCSIRLENAPSAGMSNGGYNPTLPVAAPPC